MADAELERLRTHLLLYIAYLGRVCEPMTRGPQERGRAAAQAEAAEILRGILDGQAPPREAGLHPWETSRPQGAESLTEAPAQAAAVRELALPD